jgi:hypothetical protein
MSDDLGPWPEKVYLLHPSIKSFGDMVTNPERREYVLAETAEAKLAKAVDALRVISQFNAVTNSHLNVYNIFKITDRARAALAELEGGGERDQKQGG